MTRNFLIGIGGTGARVIESVLHCCAAGLGPEKLFVFLVDPDQGNGNLSRTNFLLSAYRRARQALGQRAGKDVRLFSTEIVAPEPFVWSIFEHRKETLANYVGREMLRPKEPDLVELMELLFSEKELNTALDEGFRGHPSIGAVAMAGPNMDAEPWKSFWDEVTECGPREARVMLVGSIFGGTGAAGVPTFGAPEMLKFKDKAAINGEQRASKIHLGATLVLPYFTVRADGSHENEMFVTSDDFAIATKAALEYYNEKDLAFDQVYLVGDSLASKVGAFSPGSRSQENRAHYIEMISALAAFDFYRRPLANETLDRPYFIAGRKSSIVNWESLPVASAPEAIRELQGEAKLRIAALTAFCYALLTYGKEILATPHDSLRAVPWYREHFDIRKGGEMHDPRQGAAEAGLKATSDYAHRLLQWVSELDEDNVSLIDRTKLWADEGKGVVAPWKTHPKAIATFMKAAPGTQTFDEYVTILNGLSMADLNLQPASRLLNLLYQAAADFSRSNYGIASEPAGVSDGR